MDERKIKFAVLGLGLIGKRHIAMIEANSNAELIAICDIKSKNQTKVKVSGDIPYYQDLESMLLDSPEIDVVNICTPNGLHARQSISCLSHKKHVVCEKPLGLSKSECEQVIYKALQESRNVFCVMQNRYSPPAVWLKDCLNRNLLGKIYMVQINCFWNRDERYYLGHAWKGKKNLDGGTLFTQFSHFVDILYWMFGDLKNIESKTFNFNHKELTEFEDSGIIMFELINGGVGTFNFSTSVYQQNMESSLTIIAENGSIKVGGQYMNEIEYCHIKGEVVPDLPPSNPSNDYGHYKGSAANHQYVIENVIDTLKGKTMVSTNALEGLKVVEIIERMYAKRESHIIA